MSGNFSVNQEILEFYQKSGKSQENRSDKSAWCLKENLKVMSAAKKCMVLVLITPFIEYVLKVTIKIIFHHSITVCITKSCKLNMLMAVRIGGSQTRSYILLFIGQETFSQWKVRKKWGNLIDSHVWESLITVIMYSDMCWLEELKWKDSQEK